MVPFRKAVEHRCIQRVPVSGKGEVGKDKVPSIRLRGRGGGGDSLD